MGGVVRYVVVGIGDYGGLGLDCFGYEGEVVLLYGFCYDFEYYGCGMYCSYY